MLIFLTSYPPLTPCNPPQVRDMFSLGPPPLQVDRSLAALARRGQKKQNRESPATKARQMARNKNRDNRAAAKTYDD